MVKKDKGKPLELSLLSKIVNQKQYHVPWWITEVSATTEDLKDAGMVFPHHISFQLSHFAEDMHKTGGSWRMTSGLLKINHMVALIAVALTKFVFIA